MGHASHLFLYHCTVTLSQKIRRETSFGMALALVLFDQDGCTAVLKTSKLKGHDDESIRKGLVCTTLWQKTSHKVEVIEVSDSNTYLNDYEDDWATSHRALELDRVKAVRGQQDVGGYLDVWPQDIQNQDPGSEPTSTENQHSNATTKKRKGNTQDVQNTSAKNAPKRKMTAKKTPARTRPVQNIKEKHGTNGRKVVVHFEGSGEYQEEGAIPGRSPFFTDDLTEDQVDMVHQEIQQHLAGKSSISTQTDTVAVITPEELTEIKRPRCDQGTSTDLSSNKLDLLCKNVRELQRNQQRILDVLERLDRRNSLADFQALIGVGDTSANYQETESITPSIVFQETLPTDATQIATSVPVIPSVVTLASVHVDAVQEDFPQETEVIKDSGATVDSSLEALPTDIPHQPTEMHMDSITEDNPPVLTFPILPTPVRRRKVSKCQIPCGAGAVVEIESSFDMVGVGRDAEVRIKPVLLQESRESDTPSGVFAWRIARQIYSKDEMRSRNVYGSRGRQALSPRRAHALEHSVIDIYGAAELKPAVSSINTGIRNISYRERLYASRAPLHSLENCM